MGMYQPQNYGKDFMESFTGMGKYLTGVRKAESDLKQQTFENDLKVKADERAQTQLDDTLENSAASREYKQTQSAEARRKAEQEKILQDGALAHANFTNGTGSKADLEALAKFRIALPDIGNDTANQEQESQTAQIIREAAETLDKLPARNVPMAFQQGDNPLTDKYLEAVNRSTPPSRFKEFVDEKGTITGTAGAKYRTDKIYGGAVVSGDGTGSIVHRMSIVDAEGNSIFEKDSDGNILFKKNDDGTAMLDPATGEPIPQPKLVPSTFRKSNGEGDRLNLIPSPLLKLRAEITSSQIAAEKAIPPEMQKEYAKLLARNAAAYGDPKGYFNKADAANRLNSLTPEQKAAFGEGGERMFAVGAQLGLSPEQTTTFAQKSAEALQARKDKFQFAKSEAELKRQENARRDTERQQDRQDNIKLIASLKPGTSGNNNESIRNKRDVATRLRSAQRGYQDALKTADPDAINESIGLIESLNADAKEYGVTPMPLPQRQFSSTENDAIKAQAIKNLNEQRSRSARVFGVSPSVPAINQEIRRLKQNAKPGSVSFESQTKAAAFTAPPPAGQHKGRMIQDDASGKRYRSDGSRWVEVR